MSEIRTYACEICGIEKGTSNHWFVLAPGPVEGTLIIGKWREDWAGGACTHHACGEQHLQSLLSQWLASGGLSQGDSGPECTRKSIEVFRPAAPLRIGPSLEVVEGELAHSY